MNEDRLAELRASNKDYWPGLRKNMTEEIRVGKRSHCPDCGTTFQEVIDLIDCAVGALPRLTEREWQVLREMALGATQVEAARRLKLTSAQNVKNHLAITFAKLNANSLNEALRVVGWLVIPPATEEAK